MKSSIWMAAVVAVSGAVLLACEGSDGGGTSRYLTTSDDNRDCAGAFTPWSEVCWDKSDVGDGPISTDSTKSEELLSDVAGTDRCKQISMPVPGAPGTLTLTFTTTELAGTYQPRNCGAAWIEDALGQYVVTLEMWAAERSQSITMWDSRACKTDPHLTKEDAITSATLDMHKTHTRTWDGKDFRGAVAPDGNYTLWLQVTESEFVPEGPYMMIPFEKGTAPWERTPTSIPGFSGIVLSYKPGAAPPTGAVQPTP